MNELIFVVDEVPEGGFTARALGHDIFTEADDLEQLHAMIRDAVRCHFDEDETSKSYSAPLFTRGNHRIMKMPRDLSGDDLAKLLKSFDYKITRQKGSHIRLTTQRNGEHHVTIPNQIPMRIGTLSNIPNSVSSHLQISKEELMQILF